MTLTELIDDLEPGDWLGIIAILKRLAIGDIPATDQPTPPLEN